MKNLFLGFLMALLMASICYGFESSIPKENCSCFPRLESFDYRLFPKLDDKHVVYGQYWVQENIAWKIYAFDNRHRAEVAVGYIPKRATPVINRRTGETDWDVDINDCPVKFYWMDLNGDGYPYKGDVLDVTEILYDPEADGLNGNEEIPYFLQDGVVSL